MTCLVGFLRPRLAGKRARVREGTGTGPESVQATRRRAHWPLGAEAGELFADCRANNRGRSR